eukprot:IDg20409t1
MMKSHRLVLARNSLCPMDEWSGMSRTPSAFPMSHP